MWMTIVSRSIDINDINGKYIVHRPLQKFKTGPHATWILKPKKFIFYPQGFLCFSFSVFIFPLHSWVSSFSLFPPFSIWMMTEHRKCMVNNTEWCTTGPSTKFIVSSMLSHKKYLSGCDTKFYVEWNQKKTESLSTNSIFLTNAAFKVAMNTFNDL